MVDYFVDASAGAGGNGLNTASAYRSVTSIAWAAGDRAWVRRTHVESLGPGTRLGPNITSPSVGFTKVAAIIGWPNSNDPMYDERPQTGIDSGWDSEAAGTAPYSLYELNFPTFACSNAQVQSGMPLGRACHYMNLCFNQLGANNNFPFQDYGFGETPYFNNVVVLRENGPLSGFTLTSSTISRVKHGKIYAVFSNNAPTESAFRFNLSCQHLVVLSPTQYNGPLFTINNDDNMSFEIGILDMRSNSVAYLFLANSQPAVFDTRVKSRIGRLIGNQPKTSVYVMSSQPFVYLAVDDYFGLGPGLFGAMSGLPSGQVVRSNDAMHNGGRVWRFDVLSSAQGTDTAWYTRFGRALPYARRYFDVVSGTAINIYVPIYMGSTAVLSLSFFNSRASLNARGCNELHNTRSMVLAGSPTLWVGSYCVGGSAYLIKMSWTPTETGNVPFETEMTFLTQATSGQQLIGYWLTGEPYSA